MRNLMNEILDNRTDTTLNYQLDYDLELNFNLKNLSRNNKISYELIDFSEIQIIFCRFVSFSLFITI